MIYRTDYHMHSTFSDGRSVPEDYIIPAIKAGLSEIGFSDHITLFMPLQHWNMDPVNTGRYIDHIRNLKESTAGITIKTGLEVDYFPGKEEQTREFLNALPLDYVIGSVHYLGDQSVDMGPEYYVGKDVDRIFSEYFDTVCEAAASGLFDIIGHCDLVRIFGYRASDPEPLYRKLARALKESDITFEVNTNGRNKPVGDFYPDRRFLNVFLEEGVPVCVNSDAHMPQRVGQYFDEAYELLRYSGFTEMAVFEKRKRTMMAF
jgi:histidinol-phosphatase (PHP family)